MNFVEYSTKDIILKEVWKKGKLQEGSRLVYFHPDYPAEMVKKMQRIQRYQENTQKQRHMFPNTVYQYEGPLGIWCMRQIRHRSLQ